MRIKHQVAVITGASSGIGAALARELARRGIAVGLTARRGDLLNTLAGEIRAAGGTADVAAADATDPAATRAAITRLGETLGPIDLLVANAGLGLSTPASRFSAETVDRMIRVNLTGAAYAIEAVLPAMIERGRGHLVGISSLAAYRGLPFNSGYCASKAGLTALLEAMRIELRPLGVAVTVVHPGYVRTPMTEGADHWQPFLMDADRAARNIANGIAAGRREVDFPWPTAALMYLARRMPTPVYDRLAGLVFLPRRQGR